MFNWNNPAKHVIEVTNKLSYEFVKFVGRKLGPTYNFAI